MKNIEAEQQKWKTNKKNIINNYEDREYIQYNVKRERLSKGEESMQKWMKYWERDTNKDSERNMKNKCLKYGINSAK